MQEVEVVRLHEGVDRQLPVGREPMLAPLDPVVRGEAEGRQLRRRTGEDRRRVVRLRRQGHEDQAGLLLHAEGCQPHAVAVDIGEALLAGQGVESPVVVVAPRVVGADQEAG